MAYTELPFFPTQPALSRRRLAPRRVAAAAEESGQREKHPLEDEACRLRSVVGLSCSLLSGLPGMFTSKRSLSLDSREHGTRGMKATTWRLQSEKFQEAECPACLQFLQEQLEMGLLVLRRSSNMGAGISTEPASGFSSVEKRLLSEWRKKINRTEDQRGILPFSSQASRAQILCPFLQTSFLSVLDRCRWIEHFAHAGKAALSEAIPGARMCTFTLVYAKFVLLFSKF
ncbi:hypothetical protein MHYP_G00072770 [Metynnis hypsauchen]